MQIVEGGIKEQTVSVPGESGGVVHLPTSHIPHLSVPALCLCEVHSAPQLQCGFFLS